jgi:hypothetical protein
MPMNVQALIDKIQTLPADRLAEVEDFVDFIQFRGQQQLITRSAAASSADVFAVVWDNPEDDVYNAL